MKKLTWWIGITLIALCLTNCSSRYQSHEDEFYNDTGAYPSSRIPLIKPYELYSKEGEPWELFLYDDLSTPPPDNTIMYVNVHDVRKVSIKNGIIMVYSPFTDGQVERNMRQYFFHWFVIAPGKSIVGFYDEEAFLKYIQQFGIHEPEWKEPNDVYDEYVQNQCLDWIPDCK